MTYGYHWTIAVQIDNAFHLSQRPFKDNHHNKKIRSFFLFFFFIFSKAPKRRRLISHCWRLFVESGIFFLRLFESPLFLYRLTPHASVKFINFPRRRGGSDSVCVIVQWTDKESVASTPRVINSDRVEKSTQRARIRRTTHTHRHTHGKARIKTTTNNEAFFLYTYRHSIWNEKKNVCIF